MEFLPFAFCESGSSLLHVTEVLKLKKIRAKFWEKAASETANRRVNVAISISYRPQTAFQWGEIINEAWIYNLEVLDELDEPKRSITFEELQNVDREYLQVTQVNIGLFVPMEAPGILWDEMVEIVRFTIPFIYAPFLDINHSQLPTDDGLTSLLSLYQNAAISSLSCRRINRPVDEFLKNQLKSTNFPRRLSLSLREWSEDVRSAVEEFAIAKPFHLLNFKNNALVFGKAFFERLFEKTQMDSGAHLQAPFSFDFKNLREFKTKILDKAATSLFKGEARKSQQIVWRRGDGVLVTATFIHKQRWDIKWSLN